MKVLRLFQKEAGVGSARFLILAAISGLSNAGILAIINLAASHVQDKEGNLVNLLLFGITILVFVYTQRSLMVEVCHRVEQLVDRMRVRLIARARRAEFLELEDVGRAEIYSCLTRETLILSQAAPNLVIGIQSAILVIFTMIYMAFLSWTAFILSAACTIIGAFVHMSRNTQVKAELRESFEQENLLIESMSDMLEGFKEVKMSDARAHAIAQRIEAISHRVTRLRIRTQTTYATDFVFSQVTFFLLTGVMVFVVPAVSEAYTQVVVMTTTASLFMIGPVSNVVGSIPIFTNANSAAENIMRLQDRLGRINGHKNGGVSSLADFKTIVLDGASFAHAPAGGDRPFTVGPIDLTIRRGQTIFITGGNGSGKTTFVRMLIGLYPNQGGMIRVDRTTVGPFNIQDYRNLFSVIFSDNHLFAELYGQPAPDPVLVSELFELLEMQHKSRLENNRFTTTKLSGGQRKRLAMIAAILEARPICIFDEWAADQDPYFREKFYRVILPLLKEKGVTVIAITHDDAYFDVADLHVHMDTGRLKIVRGEEKALETAPG
ncbi:cyclic peptide export ABC transporter [Roseixanthobacter glucoisosaccharinicivorans]|uniref:cyclic peptide export ABC transporter n=1 Tax=Roseixanthobacter glucoisosaccharinicivorans TaxID=3119923 RepID=UPI00372A16AD